MVTKFSDLDALSLELARQVAASLGGAISARGSASVVVSGGKSPIKLFEHLRAQALNWSRVHISLADERWVEPSDSSSNEKLVRDVLLKEHAAAAHFHGLKKRSADARQGCRVGLGAVCPRPPAIRLRAARHGRRWPYRFAVPAFAQSAERLECGRGPGLRWYVVAHGTACTPKFEFKRAPGFAPHRDPDRWAEKVGHLHRRKRIRTDRRDAHPRRAAPNSNPRGSDVVTMKLEDGRTALSKEALKDSFLDDLFYIQGKFPGLATKNDYYMALAYAVRDRMLQRWISTAAVYTKSASRTVAYLSAEFLMGPHLGNNLVNLGIFDRVKQCVAELGP